MRKKVNVIYSLHRHIYLKPSAGPQHVHYCRELLCFLYILGFHFIFSFLLLIFSEHSNFDKFTRFFIREISLRPQ